MGSRALVLFCCAGGSTIGLHLLGMDTVGVDHDPDACASHAAAGFPTIRADLRQPPPVAGPFDGVWASPPCTAFSAAGKGHGRDRAEALVQAIDAEDWRPWFAPGDMADVWLILPTMAAVLDLRPTWVAMENVPATLPMLDACARVLERHGYRARTCTLQAEQYGVAQTRRRAFLLASRATAPTIPEATHQLYRNGEPAREEATLLGTTAPWVSMADALGWPDDVTVDQRRGAGMEERHGTRDDRTAATPSPTITTRSWKWNLEPPERGWLLNPGRTASQPNRRRRALEEPAPTVAFGKDAGNWCWERPATTVAGDPRLSPPGWRGGPQDYDEDGNYVGARSMDNAVRLEPEEAARLQAFPAGWPWRGCRTSVFRQIGNAVPPPVAAAIAAGAAGLPWREPVAAYLADLYATTPAVAA